MRKFIPFIPKYNIMIKIHDVEDAYRRLARAVNGLIEINGIDQYQTLCDHINRIADKALSAKR